MSTKQKALDTVKFALQNAGLMGVRFDSITSEKVSNWDLLSIVDSLRKAAEEIEGEQGGNAPALAISDAMRAYAKGDGSEKSWKIIRIELEDAKAKLEEAIEKELQEAIAKEKQRFQQIVDSAVSSAKTGEGRPTLTFECVMHHLAGDRKYIELEGELLKQQEYNRALDKACKELQEKLQAAEEKAANSKEQAEAWKLVWATLNENEPEWLAAGTSGQETAVNSIRVLAKKAKDAESDREFRQAVIKELNRKVPCWLMSGRVPVSTAAVNAIKELYGKNGELAEAKEERDALRNKLSAARSMLS